MKEGGGGGNEKGGKGKSEKENTVILQPTIGPPTTGPDGTICKTGSVLQDDSSNPNPTSFMGACNIIIDIKRGGSCLGMLPFTPTHTDTEAPGKQGRITSLLQGYVSELSSGARL